MILPSSIALMKKQVFIDLLAKQYGLEAPKKQTLGMIPTSISSSQKIYNN